MSAPSRSTHGQKTRHRCRRPDPCHELELRPHGGGGGWYLDTETGDLPLISDAVDDLPEDIEDNPRYLWIEPIPSNESYRIMEDFVDTLTDERATQGLSRALEGRKPFRRFKDTLFDFPGLRKAWFTFEREALLHLAEAWCKANKIAAEWRPVPATT